jgi:hypothetical protein
MRLQLRWHIGLFEQFLGPSGNPSKGLIRLSGGLPLMTLGGQTRGGV